MTEFRTTAIGGLLLLLLATLPALPAAAGQTLLEPGASDSIDTGERGNYTTVTIRNLGDQPGRVDFDAPIGRSVEVPAGGEVALYGNYGRPAVRAVNRGPTRLRIVTRYMESFRAP